MYRMSPWRGQELEQEFRMAQESRAKLTVREQEKRQGHLRLGKGPRGRGRAGVQDGSGVQG